MAIMREDQAMLVEQGTRRRHRVGVIALPGVYPFELSIPARVLGLAEDAGGERFYEVVTCSADGLPVATSADFGLSVAHDLSVLDTCATVMVPPAACLDAAAPGSTAGLPSDGLPSDGLPSAAASGALDRVERALRALGPGVRVASICTAVHVLARTGLLDGRPATTHWRHVAAVADRYPGVHLRPEVLYVDDGDVLTAAGAASGIDLCLHLVRRDLGAEEANRVARACVVPPHREGGQAQYVDRPIAASTESSTAAVRDWMLAHLDAPCHLSDLAERASMSVRTLTRRFRAEVGMSPMQWLTQQRVALARRLLETSDLSVEEVARRVGMNTGASLRLHMAAALGVAPSAYRSTFQAGEIGHRSGDRSLA